MVNLGCAGRYAMSSQVQTVSHTA
ncbi:protein of unknown function [Hyphomicrobium sp. 1Nfss2.1]